jgi:DMSO/TMAO reductase YedYZ molybdopterin-dependent catalytic subunit
VRLARRTLLSGSLLGLAGCDSLSDSPQVQDLLGRAEGLNRWLQRALGGRDALAREFAPADISADFRANGSTSVDDPEYQRLAEGGFAEWRLTVDGIVQRPLSLSLAELRAMPSRTQITRHDCVEGWSCIGQWTGVRLARVLALAGLRPSARYVVFRCADTLERTLDNSGQYYESVDLIDAVHPQTILAYEMNGVPLPVAHGAPLRLRVERQLGYKMAKYVMRIEVVDGFADIGRGKGSFWADRGYEWYAGI